MYASELLAPVSFAEFKQGEMAAFRRDIRKYAANMLATRDQWLALVPTFEDFRQLLPAIVESQSRHTAIERPEIVISLIRRLDRSPELAMTVYAVWATCALHVHDQIARSNRLPTTLMISAWTIEYGQQLNLAYKRDRLVGIPKSKHRGGKLHRIPPRKSKKRK